MRDFLQTVIPPILAALIAYQGGLTRTTRLRSMIRANVDLVGTLPADHPSRAKLEAHIGELVDVLIRRQRRRFEPFTRAGVWFGVNITAALFLLGGMSGLALEEIGVLHAASEPPPPRERWTFIGFYTAVGLCLAFFAFRAWRRQRREQPVDTLVRPEYRQFELVTQPWEAIVFCAGLPVLGLVGVVLMLMDPLTRSARFAGLSVFSVLMVTFAVALVAAFVRWRRESDLEDDDEEPDPDDDQADDQMRLLTAS
jgi:hypothetical protein